MNPLTRRRFIAWFSTTGAASLLAPEVLAQAADSLGTAAIKQAETVSGLTFTDQERELMENGVREHLKNFKKVRAVPLANSVAPALTFSPLLPGRTVEGEDAPAVMSSVPSNGLPTHGRDLAYLPLTQLAALVRDRKVTSVELTELYLGRLRDLDPTLRMVVTLTDDLALRQAREADREIAAGNYRGPLHGIPYGLKDLFATRGYRTTWGAAPYRDQTIDADATVVRKLQDAGAVLAAKLSVGALAWGDVWFDATTKNPWNLEQGSSGSSAGPAAAVAAGAVGFSIGTETLGSIISPCHRCGATGLRPTFGRVSRAGGMALSWSMDKVGPITRSVEDAALVLDAIRGSDGADGAVIDAPYAWDGRRDANGIRLGYDPESFTDESDDAALEQAALDTLRGMGFDPVPVKLPELPVGDLLYILEVEAAAAFDELTRSNRDDELVRQIEQAWPNVFRAARLVPAVEYVNANRVRTLLMEQMEAALADVDVYVHTTYGGRTLLATNLTGHPSCIVPNGFREDGTPSSITFTGKLFGEADLCRMARAYQDATGFHTKHPSL